MKGILKFIEYRTKDNTGEWSEWKQLPDALVYSSWYRPMIFEFRTREPLDIVSAYPAELMAVSKLAMNSRYGKSATETPKHERPRRKGFLGGIWPKKHN